MACGTYSTTTAHFFLHLGQLSQSSIGYTAGKGTGKGGAVMSKTKYRFTYDEVRVIVLALVELKNQLIEEGRYTDPIDELLVKFVD